MLQDKAISQTLCTWIPESCILTRPRVIPLRYLMRLVRLATSLSSPFPPPSSPHNPRPSPSFPLSARWRLHSSRLFRS